MQARTENSQPQTWRDNWFIINWVMAILIIRSLFKPTLSEAADTFLGDSFMLGFGTLFMMLNIFDQNMSDGVMEKAGKSLGTMTIGMAIGMASYKTIKSTSNYGLTLFSECNFKCNNDEKEASTPLLPTTVNGC